MIHAPIAPFKHDQPLTPGAELPAFSVPPITRQTLALYAGASGDHNPMHIDSDFARNAGQDDVFAHGMLVMAYLGRFLTSAFGHTRLRSWDVKFLAITRVHAELTCTATVAERLEVDGESCVRLDLRVVDQTNETKLQGVALVAA